MDGTVPFRPVANDDKADSGQTTGEMTSHAANVETTLVAIRGAEQR